MKIAKGACVLPHATMLAYKHSKQRLGRKSFFKMPDTPGLWKHYSRPISFTLIVDNSSIKYMGKDPALHLTATIKYDYTVQVDWTGGMYCGVTLDWNYEKGYVDISMSKYVTKQLTRYSHSPPNTATTLHTI